MKEFLSDQARSHRVPLRGWEQGEPAVQNRYGVVPHKLQVHVCRMMIGMNTENESTNVP